MIEKWKENLKNNFSNSPKAKIMVSVIGILIIALTITFTCVRKCQTLPEWLSDFAFLPGLNEGSFLLLTS